MNGLWIHVLVSFIEKFSDINISISIDYVPVGLHSEEIRGANRGIEDKLCKMLALGKGFPTRLGNVSIVMLSTGSPSDRRRDNLAL